MSPIRIGAGRRQTEVISMHQETAMRRNQGFVMFSIAIGLVVLVGVVWYAYMQHEASKQQMLQQAAQDFLQEHKDGRFPPSPTAAEVWAAQERRAAAGEPKPRT